jgi:hypothetical protein
MKKKWKKNEIKNRKRNWKKNEKKMKKNWIINLKNF